MLSSGSNILMKMSAIGKFPYVSLDCNSVEHGGRLVGQHSQRIVHLTNRSVVPATYSTMQQSSNDDKVFTVAPSKGRIAPGSTQELHLRFTPKTAGTFSSSVTDVDVLGGNTLRLQQQGSATTAVVTPSELALDFGDVQIRRTVRKVMPIHL
jgi:cilia- and flagella-associated protein 65